MNVIATDHVTCCVATQKVLMSVIVMMDMSYIKMDEYVLVSCRLSRFHVMACMMTLIFCRHR